MSNPLRYEVDLPCDFLSKVYILDENCEIKEEQVYGFLVLPMGIAIEIDGYHKNFYVIGANAFFTKSDAIGEQIARTLSPGLAKQRTKAIKELEDQSNHEP